MKILMSKPFLAVRPANKGWEIICKPGPMADLFGGLARDLGAINGDGPRQEEINKHLIEIIPLTNELDEILVRFVDALIDLRYETGRVQLELFSTENL